MSHGHQREMQQRVFADLTRQSPEPYPDNVDRHLLMGRYPDPRLLGSMLLSTCYQSYQLLLIWAFILTAEPV